MSTIAEDPNTRHVLVLAREMPGQKASSEAEKQPRLSMAPGSEPDAPTEDRGPWKAFTPAMKPMKKGRIQRRKYIRYIVTADGR